MGNGIFNLNKFVSKKKCFDIYGSPIYISYVSQDNHSKQDISQGLQDLQELIDDYLPT